MKQFSKYLILIATLGTLTIKPYRCSPYGDCPRTPRSFCVETYENCEGIKIARQGTTLYITQIQNLTQHNLVMRLEEYPLADLPIGAVTLNKIRVPLLVKNYYDFHTRLTFYDPDVNHVVAYLVFNKKLQQSPFGYIGATIALNNHMNQTLYEWTPADRIANERARHDVYEVKIILKGRLGLKGSSLEVKSYNAGGSALPTRTSERNLMMIQENIMR
ncbi:hypothetical protein Noda2021_12250 [Candidatus Dependentiae bacterium Noda2021]|nr:hypothetical protein Noda2021_12250 [Candidatus Dependentiae bacterium Noda2021]